ncbi:Rho-binding antiterminator [Dasania sp. GY-MA-18]|uniref:Rho-binding antiterminator n=1 Tax=Dasania phycosphaerae TaxID=2950436 RepID=A0A9J6RM09_9GAMM|nr:MULTISPECIES: Rho-binding antiterminator [Dasania]MCR8922592.1 Rho-binding antiterminator [Dasania sp. GY-MA-18]MCZ0865021.1 Rho-binding antiterminator [Dasania phycosphaerae]MCZ0868748.1 Rho-binding antiterminator [Dasania phycosphaerae]
MINCELHDYIEIACMQQLPIRLKLKSGSILKGTALDTQRNNKGEECVKINSDSHHLLVVLDDLATMEALIANPHFSCVKFD